MAKTKKEPVLVGNRAVQEIIKIDIQYKRLDQFSDILFTLMFADDTSTLDDLDKELSKGHIKSTEELHDFFTNKTHKLYTRAQKLIPNTYR